MSFIAGTDGMAPLPSSERTLISRNLRLRILSALVLAPPVLAAIFAGTPFFEFLLVLSIGIMSHEWSRMTNAGRFRWSGWTIALSAVAALGFSWGQMMPVGWAMALSLLGIAPVLLLGWRIERCKAPIWLAAGVPAIAIPVVALGWLRGQPENGLILLLWVMIVVWATDIGAYVSGRMIGGPKLAPRISPNKTWAGLLGGMSWAALVGLGFAVWLGIPPVRLMAISAGLAVVAQAGDLAESLVKRRFGVKDSGALIPGHGGLLDRVDGLLAAAPAVVLLFWLIGGSPL